MEARCTRATDPTGPENPKAALHETFTWADVNFCCLFFVFLLFKKRFFKSRRAKLGGPLGHDLRMQIARFCFSATEQGEFAPGRSGVGFALWVQEA